MSIKTFHTGAESPLVTLLRSDEVARAVHAKSKLFDAWQQW